ncbi:hypothetical protein AFLA70_114g003041 [Aspergillus flavus AF70]|nr:hypothetical protein AFLA70_114g003041 [Aspergillus flavus AF70]
MGSMADGQRQNVALTGAREGLIIVRHAEIGKYSSVAAQSWVQLRIERATPTLATPVEYTPLEERVDEGHVEHDLNHLARMLPHKDDTLIRLRRKLRKYEDGV